MAAKPKMSSFSFSFVLGLIAGAILTLVSVTLIAWATRPKGVNWAYLEQILANNVHVLGDCFIGLMWPLAVITVAFFFQDDVKVLVNTLSQRGKSITLPGIEFSLHGPNANRIDAALNKDSLGNIYWLGADLMFTVSALLERLDRAHVLHGIKQTLHHLRNCGLAGTTEQQTRASEVLESAFKETNEVEELDDVIRRKIAAKLVVLRNQIGATIEAAQNVYDDGLSDNEHLTFDQRFRRLRQ